MKILIREMYILAPGPERAPYEAWLPVRALCACVSGACLTDTLAVFGVPVAAARVRRLRVALHVATLGAENERNDEAVQTEDLGENEDEDHADEELGLLASTANTAVAHNADGVARGETRDADGETRAEVEEPPVGCKLEVGGSARA